MQQRLTFITLGVNDLVAMKTWYQQCLGWQPFKDDEGMCFFKLNGIVLGLYSANDLAEDIGIDATGSGFKRFALAINMESQEAVDAFVAGVRSRGGRVVRQPEPVFWGGYRGYIADPEDNYWEIAFNPYLPLDADGNVV